LSSNISVTTTVDSLSLFGVGVETEAELRSWRGKPLNLWKHELYKYQSNGSSYKTTEFCFTSHFTWCGYDVPGIILLHDLIVVKNICPCFNLHQLQLQRINASCVEVVALIRRVCFYDSSRK
jgi:hypothetical protein